MQSIILSEFPMFYYIISVYYIYQFTFFLVVLPDSLDFQFLVIVTCQCTMVCCISMYYNKQSLANLVRTKEFFWSIYSCCLKNTLFFKHSFSINAPVFSNKKFETNPTLLKEYNLVNVLSQYGIFFNRGTILSYLAQKINLRL